MKAREIDLRGGILKKSDDVLFPLKPLTKSLKFQYQIIIINKFELLKKYFHNKNFIFYEFRPIIRKLPSYMINT